MDLRIYKNLIQNFLPQGLAWPRQQGTNMENLVCSLAVEPQRIDARLDDLIVESYPLTSTELLIDWERVLGLPEQCEGLAPTVQKRRQAAHNKLSSIGGQSPQYYITLAESLGYEITITEFDSFVAGSVAGDPLNGDTWEHVWQVNAPEVTIDYFNAGEGSAGEPLSTWGNKQLECVLNRLKPAHTFILFSYGGTLGSGGGAAGA